MGLKMAFVEQMYTIIALIYSLKYTLIYILKEPKQLQEVFLFCIHFK